MSELRYPCLYQVNTRVWLGDLAARLQRPATLDDVPDSELDCWAESGFSWIWLLSVWQTGPLSRQVSRSDLEWRKEFQDTLPDVREDDILGSGFAISDYKVSERLGGDAALERLRRRLRQRGLRLMLDFVPNHTGLDHSWVETHPEYYVRAEESDLERAPGDYTWVKRRGGELLLAHGRDPYFPGWSDTLQLNYANPATQAAMMRELMRIAGQCDGLRCDMAMLILPEVFERTWGALAEPFWPKAIGQVRGQFPDFCFLAEVYWDLEWTLQQQGFDYAYDKRLYDRLRAGQAQPVRHHFRAGLDYQNKLARFLENHDEPRAAAVFPPEQHQAAAVITFLAPGLRFFHQGQFEGRRKRIPAHLGRAPSETPDPGLRQFYDRLLEILRVPLVVQGNWRLLECSSAWEGNLSADAFIAYFWEDAVGGKIVVAVNYSNHRSQCYVRLSTPKTGDGAWRLRDLLGPIEYERNGRDLETRGLYLDLAPWQCHVFETTSL